MIDNLVLILIIALGVYLGIMFAIGSVVGGISAKEKIAHNRRYGRPWWKNKPG